MLITSASWRFKDPQKPIPTDLDDLMRIWNVPLTSRHNNNLKVLQMATRKLSTSSPDEVQQYRNRNVTINTLLISITLTSWNKRLKVHLSIKTRWTTTHSVTWSGFFLSNSYTNGLSRHIAVTLSLLNQPLFLHNSN